MYKKITLFLLFVFIGTLSFAQLSGGIKGGLNYSNVIITNGKTYFEGTQFQPRYAYHFGSYLQKDFSKSFAWQIEMLFSNKGYVAQTGDIKSTISLNYLNWPLLLVYHAGSRLNFETGLEFGFMVSGDPLFNTFDLGIDLGINYRMNKKINAGLRYNQGLPFQMDINKQSNTEIPTYQLGTVQFYLGFNIIKEAATAK